MRPPFRVTCSRFLQSLAIMSYPKPADTAYWFLAERISASGYCSQFAEFFDRDEEAAIKAFVDFYELVPAIELTERNLEPEPPLSDKEGHKLWAADDALLSQRINPWLWDNGDNLEAFMGARLEMYTQEVTVLFFAVSFAPLMDAHSMGRGATIPRMKS